MYQIVYDSADAEKGKGHLFARFCLTGIWFAIFICLVVNFWPEGRDLLRLLLIPGEPDETLLAAEVFAQEVASGFSVTDALQNFWCSVSEHGFLP